MKTVLYIPTAHTENGIPSPWLKQRLDMALEYFQTHPNEECIFLPSGRGPNIEKLPPISEAEVCKRYIFGKLPSAKIIKEEFCVETAGGFAFSKPILDILKPDKVVIFNSKVIGERTKFFAYKIFGSNYFYEFIFLDDELSKNQSAIDKEPRAMVMFKNLLKGVKDGDDKTARDILLYETPFYFKGFVNDKVFFDKYWPGGFENKKSTESSKWGK
jgi:hypothetical protein